MLLFMGMAFPSHMAIPLDPDTIMAAMHTIDIIWVIRILVIQGVMIFIQNQILQGGDDLLKSYLIVK